MNRCFAGEFWIFDVGDFLSVEVVGDFYVWSADECEVCVYE